ncbi:hypothetical protein TRVA0_020S01926 [Trichomonascus vanleenenianus]|uniref:uncharacterized protein n=1 Tax=Trichomonascus vanleenenianus TaxID=2268995 RepID=UPI003ECAA38C
MHRHPVRLLPESLQTCSGRESYQAFCEFLITSNTVAMINNESIFLSRDPLVLSKLHYHLLKMCCTTSYMYTALMLRMECICSSSSASLFVKTASHL